MKKNLILIFSLFWAVTMNQLLAQLPEVSTSTNPRWYYFRCKVAMMLAREECLPMRPIVFMDVQRITPFLMQT